MESAVLVSGGVDSAVSLFLLKEQGLKLRAFYLKVWLEEEMQFLGNCPWEEDLEEVQKVCTKAGVPLEVIPCQKEYYERIVLYTVQELKEGRTPSPDIFCNRRIKFGFFLERPGTEFEKIASGHYAQIQEQKSSLKPESALYTLHRSPDPVKDQSYFLSHLSQEQLSRLLFPVGGLLKEETRRLAERYDLPNKQRKDSQGICFLGKIRYRDFVKHYLGEREGRIIEKESGRKLGKHKGFWFHTIGQRQGLGLSGGPWYVSGKNTEENIVYVSSRENSLQPGEPDGEAPNRHRVFTVEAPHWIRGEAPRENRLLLKLRHGPKLHACRIQASEAGRFHVELLEEGDRGIAAGQFAVFYRGDECLGAGAIRPS